MPQPAVDKRVRASAFVMFAEDAPPTTKEIRARLISAAADAAKAGTPFKIPSERTIRRLHQEYKQDLTDEERSQYRQLKWPESMEMVVAITELPWDASASVLELLALWQHERGGRRPTIRQAKWFWRITLAVPDAPLPSRECSSWILAAHEERGSVPEEELRKVEWFLAFAPWRSDDNLQSYKAAIDEGTVPQPVLQILLDPHLEIEISQDLREFIEGEN